MAVTPRLLSGSTSGRGIIVASTAATGTTIHTAQSATGITVFDEVHLWAQNLATAGKLLTVLFGGTSSGDRVQFTVPPKDGPYPIVPGWRLNNAAVVRAGAATANTVVIHGHIIRVTTA